MATTNRRANHTLHQREEKRFVADHPRSAELYSARKTLSSAASP